MTPQELKRVANLLEWTTVLEVMIKSRRLNLAFKTTKQERWNQRTQDRPAHKEFLEEH
jgi:ribosomal protein S1